MPITKLISPYGLVGRLTASEIVRTEGSVARVDLNLRSSSGNMNNSNSLQVTSHLPIQKGEIFTLCAGPSSGLRPASASGLPIMNSPAGIGIIPKETDVPGTVLV